MSRLSWWFKSLSSKIERKAPCRSAFFLFSQKKPKRERGQATLEYALLMGTAAALGLGFYSSFQGTINQAVVGFNAILEKELVSGNFNESRTTWEN